MTFLDCRGRINLIVHDNDPRLHLKRCGTPPSCQVPLSQRNPPSRHEPDAATGLKSGAGCAVEVACDFVSPAQPALHATAESSPHYCDSYCRLQSAFFVE